MSRAGKWLIVVFLIAAYIGKIVMIPLFLSVFLAMLLDPFVKSLRRLGISRFAGSLFVVCAFGAVTMVFAWLGYLSALELTGNIPVYLGKFNKAVSDLAELGAHLKLSTAPAEQIPTVQIAQSYPAWTTYVFASLGGIYEAASIIIFVPLLLFYLLSDKENLVESFNVLHGRYYDLPKLNHELPRMLRVFFAANLITVLGLIVVQGIFLYLVKYDNWLALALITGVLNLLPAIGGPLAVIATLLLGIGPAVTAPLALMVFAYFMTVHFFANNLALPLLVGARVNINTFSLIVGLLFWSWMWGTVGFVLAVPMTALIKILLECNPETFPLANLMAAKPTRLLEGKGEGVHIHSRFTVPGM